MDDWDIIIPNDSANITRLHAALKKLKNIFGEAFKCGYAHGHTIFGMNMFIRLPITPYSKDNEEKNQAWALAQLDVFFVDISDGTIRQEDKDNMTRKQLEMQVLHGQYLEMKENLHL